MRGMGFLYIGSNRPSACNFAFSCSKARFKAPAPSGITSEIYSCTCPVRGNELTRARTMTFMPFSSRNFKRIASERNITALIDAPASFRLI